MAKRLAVLNGIKYPWLANLSPIHRNVRANRVNDLIRNVTLHATAMTSGSLEYLSRLHEQ